MRSDEELMVAYQGGDSAAFETLMQRYQGRIHRFLLRLLRNESLAEEAVVETFFKLHRATPTYQSRANFSPFLFTIAYREGLMVLRKQRQQAGIRALVEDGAINGTVATSVSRVPESPEAWTETRGRLSAVDRALELLTTIQKVVFLLYYREELSTADIATALDIPRGSVRAYLCQARKTLCEVLETWERPSAGVASGSGR